MTREERLDWLCRLRADLNNGVIFTPWNKEFTEALNSFLEQNESAEEWYKLFVEKLEQEPVLEKIIAEIDEKISHYEHFSSSNTANGLTMAKEIVEKYRESEGI